MNGHQRRRASCVDGHRRPFETERERNPADRSIQRGSGDRIEAGCGVEGLGGFEDHVSVVVVADADVDAGAAAAQARRIDGRVFEGPPARVEHQALLRVEHLCFDGRDAEELGVELVQVVDERAESECLAAGFRFGIEPTGATDDRTRRTLGDGVLAGHELTPELRQVPAAWEAAGHPDDRHRLLGWEFALFHNHRLHRGLTNAAVTAAVRFWRRDLTSAGCLRCGRARQRTDPCRGCRAAMSHRACSGSGRPRCPNPGAVAAISRILRRPSTGPCRAPW